MLAVLEAPTIKGFLGMHRDYIGMYRDYMEYIRSSAYSWLYEGTVENQTETSKNHGLYEFSLEYLRETN